jgi:hypothetical protein
MLSQSHFTEPVKQKIYWSSSKTYCAVCCRWRCSLKA